ncbi:MULTISPECIES: ABC transporter ATP-binding protein [Microbacterium]|jgi:ABC-2 type transport system ATP-binding protein|uniref:ABC transporter ATP-binding protein n=1 Tax=Microbacterium TaxID=33882 RepID=UPI001D1778B0|nr:ABC transporter ATP-binding protein [Microbacterium testaceum]MCC4249410.1 ATP-binding cassette domain-containing protein [Microbacterium testaceum]
MADDDPTPPDVAVEEPQVGEPTTEPRAGGPTSGESAVEEPVVEEPVVEEPAAEQPPSDEPGAEGPASGEPADAEPRAADPGVEEPQAEGHVLAEPAGEDSATHPSPAAEAVAEDTAVDRSPSEQTDSETSPAAEAPEGATSTEEELADRSRAEDPTPADVAVETATEEAPEHEAASSDVPMDIDIDGPDGGDSAASAAEVAGAAIGAASVEAGESSEDVPALRLRNVTKTFGELRAVDGVDLTVPAGSFYGLVGPNGAGKTTTLSIIAGLLRSDGGTVEINGVDAGRRSRAAKKMIGVLPDRLRTFDRLTGRQLLSYYGALRGLPSPVVESRAADLARAFDLVEALGRPVSDYSAGMTKKVMLAGAMIHSPRLLVLDEPFDAVDPTSSTVILDILRGYVDHGGTVILSSHGMELVERVCSRVAVIVSGQVLAEGTVDEVRGGSTLEQRFLELSGGLGDVEGLEWLHTFSA